MLALISLLVSTVFAGCVEPVHSAIAETQRPQIDADARVFGTHIPADAGTIAIDFPVTRLQGLPRFSGIEFWTSGADPDQLSSINLYSIFEGNLTLKGWGLAGGDGAMGFTVNTSRDHLIIIGTGDVGRRIQITFALLDDYIASYEGPVPEVWLEPDIVAGAATISYFVRDSRPVYRFPDTARDVEVDDARVVTPGGQFATGRLRVTAEHESRDAPALYITELWMSPTKSVGTVTLEQSVDGVIDSTSWDYGLGPRGSSSAKGISFGTHTDAYAASFEFEATADVIPFTRFSAITLPIDVRELDLAAPVKRFDDGWARELVTPRVTREPVRGSEWIGLPVASSAS